MDLDHSVILNVIRVIFFGLLIVFLRLLWAHLRRVRYKNKRPPKVIASPEEAESLLEYVIVRVDALPGREFNPEKVYTKLSELGLVFNDFAFEYEDENLNKVIFTVFNKRNDNKLPEDCSLLRNFDGLMFVMCLPIDDGSHQIRYFTTMLAIIDELRKHLSANLCNEHGTRLKDSDLQFYYDRIETFEQRYGEHFANAYR